MFERSLEGFQKLYGKDHLLTLNTMNNVALLLLEENKLIEAESYYYSILESKEKMFPLELDNPEVLSAVNNLAVAYKYQERFEEAKNLYIRALTGYTNKLGKLHPTTNKTRDNLEIVIYLAAQKKLQEAKMGDQVGP